MEAEGRAIVNTLKNQEINFFDFFRFFHIGAEFKSLVCKAVPVFSCKRICITQNYEEQWSGSENFTPGSYLDSKWKNIF